MNEGLLHADATVAADDVRPSSIVVAINDGAPGSLRALAIGRRAASAFGAELAVVAVQGDHPRADLEGVQDVAQVTTSWHTAPDRSQLATAVLDVISSRQPATVCVATKGPSPPMDVVREEIAQEILRLVDLPVLLVGPHCRIDEVDGPVVVAHDGSPHGDDVLDAARVWAAVLGVTPVVLHVHSEAIGASAQVHATLELARKRLGANAQLEIVRGSFAAGAIREYTHEVDAQLVALTTRGRTHMLTASTGRTATWLVRESACPVLVAQAPAIVHR